MLVGLRLTFLFHTSELGKWILAGRCVWKNLPPLLACPVALRRFGSLPEKHQPIAAAVTQFAGNVESGFAIDFKRAKRALCHCLSNQFHHLSLVPGLHSPNHI